MIHAPPSPATAAPAPSEAAAETKAERVERQAKMLREMQAIVISIARAEEQVALARAAQAMNAAEAGLLPTAAPAGGRSGPGSPADPGLAISRIARTLRLTLAMESRLYDDLEAEAAAAAARAAEPTPEEERRKDARVRGGLRSATILPVVEQAIEAAQDPEGDGGDTERRLDHLYERLQDEDEIVSFGTLPIGASVARLCAALGLAPDWSLWEDKAWAIREAESGAAGSPYGRGWTGRWDEGVGDAARDKVDRAETVDADPP